MLYRRKAHRASRRAPSAPPAHGPLRGL